MTTRPKRQLIIVDSEDDSDAPEPIKEKPKAAVRGRTRADLEAEPIEKVKLPLFYSTNSTYFFL